MSKYLYHVYSTEEQFLYELKGVTSAKSFNLSSAVFNVPSATSIDNGANYVYELMDDGSLKKLENSKDLINGEYYACLFYTDSGTGSNAGRYRTNATGYFSASSIGKNDPRKHNFSLLEVEEKSQVAKLCFLRFAVNGTTVTPYTKDYVSNCIRNSGYVKIELLKSIEAQNGTYPNDGMHSDGLWYVRGERLNSSPKISGSDFDLGGKTDNFEIDYLVTDEDSNDKVKVTIELGLENSLGEIKHTHDEITLGAKYKYTVPVDSLELGNYIIRIRAIDLEGDETARTYYFQKVNSAPTIKIFENPELGNRNTPFSIKYQVSDANMDKLTVNIRINRAHKDNQVNVAHDTDLLFNVSKEELLKYPLGQRNIIEIEVKDDKGATVYEWFYFTRSNSLPEISDVDRNLGEQNKAFSVDYSVSDQEGDKVFAAVYLDDKEVVEFGEVLDGEMLKYTISEEQYLKLEPGKTHKIRIEATDQHAIDQAKEGKPVMVKREFTFKKKWTDVEIVIDIADSINKIDEIEIPVDENGKIILAGRATTFTLTPEIYLAGGATVNYLACNNGYDENPVWEDVTNIVYSRGKHFFTNKTKTSEKWMLKIKIVGKRNTAVENSRFRALAGSFGFVEQVVK